MQDRKLLSYACLRNCKTLEEQEKYARLFHRVLSAKASYHELTCKPQPTPFEMELRLKEIRQAGDRYRRHMLDFESTFGPINEREIVPKPPARPAADRCAVM